MRDHVERDRHRQRRQHAEEDRQRDDQRRVGVALPERYGSADKAEKPTDRRSDKSSPTTEMHPEDSARKHPDGPYPERQEEHVADAQLKP
jgi:hypothetical protein